MNENRKHAGYTLALMASILLLTDIVLLLFMGGGVLKALFDGFSLSDLMIASGLPIGIYFSWALAILGSIAGILAITFYGFRERWFWRCLVIASIVWLIFPPIHTVIGLVSLILLISCRSVFPKYLMVAAPPP